MKRSIGVSSPVSYCASRLPPSSHRTYVALLIKWRSVLRIFTAAPMSLTPARPAPEAPAAEPVGESSPPPSPTGGASPTTPPDPQPKQTEPEQADPQPKQAEPEPNLGTRTQSQSRRRRLGRAEKGKAAASTLAVDYSDGRGPNGCWMAQYPDGNYRPVLRDAPDASPCDGDASPDTTSEVPFLGVWGVRSRGATPREAQEGDLARVRELDANARISSSCLRTHDPPLRCRWQAMRLRLRLAP